MEEINLKKIWKEKNVETKSKILLTREQISGLVRKRESQLTGSVRLAVITGLSIKFLLLIGILVFSLLYFESSNMGFSISALFIITTGMIIYDFYLLKLLAGLNNYADTIESRLGKFNDFLSVHFPVYQIENSLSTPVLVIMGMFYYHFIKYSEFKFRSYDDIIVFILVVLISFAVSFLATRYSLNAFRKEAMELLEAGNEQDEIVDFEDRMRKNRRKRLLISLLILLAGLALFILLLLL
ncbi:MAG TPA: hypothetical protein ENH59_07140 [Bacteroidetes bacterium]|nr:hypothetical protein [Bacteroidota bacterium]